MLFRSIYSIRNAFYGNRTGVYNKDTQTAPSLLGFIYSKDGMPRTIK